MNKSKISSRLAFAILFTCCCVLVSPSSYAQDEYPREYTNPAEIVAFDRSTSYAEAMEVINQFIQEYRNKFIIDQTGTSGNIGVSLPAMHWEDALSYILRLKGLASIETEEYVEIVPLSTLQPEEELTEEEEPDSELDVDFKTREVRINATFFEGNKRALQEIGIDWSTLTSGVPDNLNEIVAGEGGGSDLGVPQPTEFTDQFVSVNSYNATTVSQNVFNALVNSGPLGNTGIRVQALFSAFEADNLGEILATPSVKVMDGEQGKIQVGQDFSIKQRDIAGNVTDQFFETGTILTVTPTVVTMEDTSFIHLEIAVERSSAQPDAVSTIINKQSAQTQALLLNGEATSIAGLYRTEETRVRRGIPILKDLPPWFFGLRYLFGYNSNDYVENELIIIVQASLEESLGDRIKRRLKNKREIFTETRANFRTDMDRVYDNPFASIPDSLSPDTLIEPEIDQKPAEDIFEEENMEIPDQDSQEDTASPEQSDSEDPSDSGDQLTQEQEQLAAELSMPVDNPELMVVVPQAFSLDDYLTRKANGTEVEDTDASEQNLRYFIIGGSFIVKNNADRFNRSLQSEGYETRVLFHPESRFNYVAYKGFASFDEAVLYLMDIRQDQNGEAWLFTKTD